MESTRWKVLASVSGFTCTFLDNSYSCRKFPNGDYYLQVPTFASGRRAKFLAVVLAAWLVGFYLHISYSTLALVLALEQLHVHGLIHRGGIVSETIIFDHL